MLLLQPIWQWIKEHRYYLLTFISGVMVAWLAYYVFTLWSENLALSSHLQALENDKTELLNRNQKLIDEKEQIKAEFQSDYQNLLNENQKLIMKKDQIEVELQSIKNDLQKLIDQTNQLQKEIDLSKLELQSSKDYSQTLLDQNDQLENDKTELLNRNQKLIDENEQIKAEFQSDHQNLLNENQKLIMKKNQIEVELQSIKNDLQKLIDQTNQLRKEIDLSKLELQSSKEYSQTLLDQNNQLQKKIDRIKVDLESIKEESEKLRKENESLQEEIDQLTHVHKVYRNQTKYIQIWMESTKQLEDHIKAVIHYSELKKKGSEFYSYPEEEKIRMAELHREIGYDFHESHASEIIIKAINLIIKFKKECRKFMSALYLNKIEEMKTQQKRTDMKMIERMMKAFVEEVSGFKYPKSEETAVQKDTLLSKIGHAVYWFGGWAVRMIVQLFL